MLGFFLFLRQYLTKWNLGFFKTFKTSKELSHQDIAVLVNSVLKSLYLLSIFTHTQNAPGDLQTRYQTTLYVSGKLPPPPPHPKGRGRWAVSQKRIIIHSLKHEKVEPNFFQLVQSIASRCNRRQETASVPKYSLLKIPKLNHYYFLEFNWCENKF